MKNHRLTLKSESWIGLFVLSTFIFHFSVLAVQAQEQLSYRRNSLATMLVYHPEDEFGDEIYKAFDSLPIPDKYDDHTIDGMRVINNMQVLGIQKRDTGYYKAVFGHQLNQKEMLSNAQYTED